MALLPGEALTFEAGRANEPPPPADEAINDKYVRGEIRIVTEQARYPLNTIAKIVESPEYRLSPEYQRRHRWTVAQQSRLIESLIMNVPVPPIFLYEYDYSKYEVMDGLQRLTAIHAFYRDRFALEGLDQWSELNGKTYSKLPEKIREGIDRRYLSSVILLKETARNDEDALKLKQLVFERINSGGAKLTPQETRNAIFDGPLNQLCIKLSKAGALCRLWGIPEPTASELAGGEPGVERAASEQFREMADVELVLRFFAFRQKAQLHRGGPLSAYLDAFLRHGNTFEPRTLVALESVFLETVALVEDTFGERAFWLFRHRQERWLWREAPTTIVYDALMAVASQYLDRAREVRDRSREFRTRIEAFYKENYDTFEGRNVNPSALVAREEAFDSLFKGVLSGK